MGNIYNAETGQSFGSTGRVMDPEQQLRQQSQRLLDMTDPLRTALFRRSRSFLNGGFDVTTSPEFAFMKGLVGRNSDLARENILDTMPAGGTLLDKLADVDINQANTMTGIGADLYNRELDRATSLATGAPLMSGMGGLNSILQLIAAREGAAATREAGEDQMLGMGLGGLLGGIFE